MSLGAIAWWTRPSPAPAAPPPAPVEPGFSPGMQVERSIPPPPTPPPSAEPRPRRSGVAHPAPTDPPQPVVLRPSRQVYDFIAGLGDLQVRIDRCAERLGPADADDPRAGGAVLRLDMETLEGRVRILDAALEREGGASTGFVGCAQRVLRGALVPMHVARPGTRLQMQFPLTRPRHVPRAMPG